MSSTRWLWLYRFLMAALVPIVILGLCFRGFRNSAYWSRWSERFGFVPKGVVSGAPYDVWIHAVSVGEARAAAPLVKALHEKHPDLSVLVTATTPTGSAMVKLMLGSRVAHCYFPYDLRSAMLKFARSVKPKLGIVMETEIWPEMIFAMKEVGCDLFYTNVRLSAKSFSNYSRFQPFIAHVLSHIDYLAAQGDQDEKHLRQLGVASEKVCVTGSIKFDVVMPPSLHEMAEVTRRQLGQDRLIFIAGSTRDGEEGRILSTYKDLKEKYPSLLLIIVPRHPERFDYVARKIGRRNLKLVRRTEQQHELDSDVDVYLGDTMGELSLLYASSDVAFVGGSLEPLGGQNILEPCALGVPVVFGPHMFNFPDISKWTIKEGAGKMVKDGDELTTVVDQLLGNASLRDEIGANGLAFIEAHRGALEKNLELVESRLSLT
ncbi:MAG: lipid IV(A) 3-deoxy-D-manno-octulosonic acid transferase [Pseudomonadota bacterium]